MKLEHFYMFIKVVDSHTIRKASEEFFTSPQNMSKEMIAFERDLNTKLFDRTTKGIVLTEDGRYAYEALTRITADIDRFKAHFQCKQT